MSDITQRVGITFSAFDLLHAGHILMLKEAKTFCDYLIVGLHEDPSLERDEKNKPIQSLEERLIQLEAVKYVDEIRVYKTEEDLINLLDEIRPFVRIIGSEYLGKDFTGLDFCNENGIFISYNTRNHNWSSSELRKRIIDAGE